MTDKNITQKSICLDTLDPGDVLADRGFTPCENIAVHGARKIPPLHVEKVLITRRCEKSMQLFKVKIHVERAC